MQHPDGQVRDEQVSVGPQADMKTDRSAMRAAANALETEACFIMPVSHPGRPESASLERHAFALMHRRVFA